MILEQVKANMKHTKHVSRFLQNAQIDRVPFDAFNKEHRAAFAQYLNTGKWPMMFTSTHAHLHVVESIQQSLIAYALREETPAANLN